MNDELTSNMRDFERLLNKVTGMAFIGKEGDVLTVPTPWLRDHLTTAQARHNEGQAPEHQAFFVEEQRGHQIGLSLPDNPYLAESLMEDLAIVADQKHQELKDLIPVYSDLASRLTDSRCTAFESEINGNLEISVGAYEYEEHSQAMELLHDALVQSGHHKPGTWGHPSDDYLNVLVTPSPEAAAKLEDLTQELLIDEQVQDLSEAITADYLSQTTDTAIPDIDRGPRTR